MRFPLALALLFAVACGVAEPDEQVSLPPVLLIVADTLRADRLGSYGNEHGHTPTLDALAAGGVVVARAIAPAPWTQPSIASLLSGSYPGVHGVTRYGPALEGAMQDGPRVAVFSDDFETLAEALQRAGYATAAFVANPFVAGAFGFEQGFDHFSDPPAHKRWQGGELNAAALSWLDAQSDDATPFLYLHYMDAHGPWETAPERLAPLLDAVEARPSPRRLTKAEREGLGYLQRLPRDAVDPARHARLSVTLDYWRARYDGAVRELDAHLGALVAALEARGIWQRALVIFTSDHGEALLDRGLWDHGFSLQDAELHVPLVWRFPGTLPAGIRVAGAAGLVDVLPTTLDLLSLPPVAGVQGRSLASSLRGAELSAQLSAELRDPPAFAESVKSGPEQKTVYQGRYQLVQVQSETGTVERLFDLEDVVEESGDVSSEHPEVVRALREALEGFLRDNAALRPGDPSTAALSEARRRRLEALGYLGAPTPSSPGPGEASADADGSPGADRPSRERTR